ncbi:MAG: hypothetical protein JXA60_00245 [Candidatus Coatesbacteria bacterium]|nr:hypothetical protein [Candidatus Coatesbacteria bacterium]
MRISKEIENSISRSITEIEEASSAEIVIAFSFNSSEYKDQKYLWGVIGIFLGLILQSILLLVKPDLVIAFYSVLLNALFFFFLFYYIAHESYFMRTLLISKRKRKEICISKANLMFQEKHLSGTMERNCLLIFLFPNEKEIIWLPDIGIEQKIRPADINEIFFGLSGFLDDRNFIEEFEKRMSCLKKLLSCNFPPSKENPDEIPNTMWIIK